SEASRRSDGDRENPHESHGFRVWNVCSADRPDRARSCDSNMTNYAKLPTWADSEHVYAVVETPRGSRAKLEFDPKRGAFTLAKPLLAGLMHVQRGTREQALGRSPRHAGRDVCPSGKLGRSVVTAITKCRISGCSQ